MCDCMVGGAVTTVLELVEEEITLRFEPYEKSVNFPHVQSCSFDSDILKLRLVESTQRLSSWLIRQPSS